MKEKIMQKIVPFLWFNDQAEEAVHFYTSVFKNSRVGKIAHYGGETPQPKGSVMTIEFELEGQKFAALNGGPVFHFTPAVSFFVTLESEKEVDTLWEKLADGGTVLMPFQKYDWSEKYGWLNDKYGVSWQVALGKRSEAGQAIVPSLLFVGEQFGKAEEALCFYTSLFEGSRVIQVMHNNEEKSSVMYAQFQLAGQTFSAMDSDLEHHFTFTEANSFVVNCTSQEEIDHFWNALSAHPTSEQCGWLKDKYGVSWQIVPTVLFKLLDDPNPQKARRVTEAMLQMKKLDIATLKQAYEQN
jgi:predicted 3-demethylubiquinone-9 3-methyltransferase (glyoxalase superfamily)